MQSRGRAPKDSRPVVYLTGERLYGVLSQWRRFSLLHLLCCNSPSRIGTVAPPHTSNDRHHVQLFRANRDETTSRPDRNLYHAGRVARSVCGVCRKQHGGSRPSLSANLDRYAARAGRGIPWDSIPGFAKGAAGIRGSAGLDRHVMASGYCDWQRPPGSSVPLRSHE